MINLIAILAAYLLGSIPTGLWVGKAFYKTDIREHGSKNLGATNSFRVLGKKPGLVVTVVDVLKGTAAVLLPLLTVFNDFSLDPLVLGIAALVGHMLPIFAGFRGGKAVATSAGVLLGYTWPLFVLIFFVFFISLKIFKMVSLTSMISATVAFIYGIVDFFVHNNIGLLILTFVLWVFIMYKHRANIERMKNGTEPKVTWI